jgi:hypothetical protein
MPVSEPEAVNAGHEDCSSTVLLWRSRQASLVHDLLEMLRAFRISAMLAGRRHDLRLDSRHLHQFLAVARGKSRNLRPGLRCVTRLSRKSHSATALTRRRTRLLSWTAIVCSSCLDFILQVCTMDSIDATCGQLEKWEECSRHRRYRTLLCTLALLRIV